MAKPLPPQGPSLGFSVSKPWGESDRYDFIVDCGGHIWRVQVKSAHSSAINGYGFSAAIDSWGVEEKLCFEEGPAAAGVVGTVNRRFKELWENRLLVFPQLRQFPQRFSPPNFRLRCEQR